MRDIFSCHIALSVRLGTGKGGIKEVNEALALSLLKSSSPSVALESILNADSSTEFAVLVDDKLYKNEGELCAKALSGDGSPVVQITCQHLETIMEGKNRRVHKVDLDVEAKVDKDNPPDLKYISDAIKPLDATNILQVNDSSTKSSNAKQSKKEKKMGGASLDNGSLASLKTTMNIVDLTDQLIDITGGSEVGEEEIRRIKADIMMRLNNLRNSAYAAGFAAARIAHPMHPC